MAGKFPIATPRLIIREVKIADGGQILTAMACPEIAAMHSGGLNDISAVRSYIEVLLREYRDGRFRTLVIAEKTSDELCGTITIDMHGIIPRAELSYWISAPYRNRGYATEAVKAAIGYGFLQLSLLRIQATHAVDNPASGRVLEKAGMIFEGILRQYFGTSDVKMYAIVKSDIE